MCIKFHSFTSERYFARNFGLHTLRLCLFWRSDEKKSKYEVNLTWSSIISSFLCNLLESCYLMINKNDVQVSFHRLRAVFRVGYCWHFQKSLPKRKQNHKEQSLFIFIARKRKKKKVNLFHTVTQAHLFYFNLVQINKSLPEEREKLLTFDLSLSAENVNFLREYFTKQPHKIIMYIWNVKEASKENVRRE